MALSRPVPERQADLDTPDFDSVYAEHFAFVWRTARRLGVSPSSMDDVVQDVFVVVHRRLGDFQGRSALKTWLFGVTLRVVASHRRSGRRRATETLSHEVPDPNANPMDTSSRAEAARLVHLLLDELDDKRRSVFILAELEQMSAPEIAAAVGSNINTVYSRLRTARRQFESALARYNAKSRWRSP
ncbi:MAG TPA: RNA polymerase sigma factor [Polyangiaceae bacterium]|jgi:RNA polymerase sigma-70 factor (ECF subfamily)